MDLTPPHAGILRFVGGAGGISQQELAGHLRILPSRLVVLIDQLEERGMIERRADPERPAQLRSSPDGQGK